LLFFLKEKLLAFGIIFSNCKSSPVRWKQLSFSSVDDLCPALAEGSGATEGGIGSNAKNETVGERM
jgi:hypothetical protein